MYRQRILPLLLALLGLFAAIELVAQESRPPTREEIGDRIEALHPRVMEAGRLAGLAERAFADSVRAASQLPQDTVTMGLFEIVTLEGEGALAREMFQPHVEELTPLIRGSEGLFRTHSWTFFYGWWQKPIYADAEVVHEVKLSRRYSLDRLQKDIRASLGEALYRVLPEDAEGLGNIASPGSFLPPDDWSWVYRELASATYLAARHCLEGDLTWCWEALGVTGREGNEPEWDSPTGRRRLIESRYERLLWREHDRLGTLELLVRGCLLLESDRACGLVLEGYHLRDRQLRKDYPIPLRRGRGTLVAEALRMGGEGSFTRLISRPEDPLRDRLAHAAGVSPETLVARWRDRVLEARPNAQAGLLRSPLALLFWLALIILFATRSSRWRLG